MVRLLTDVLQPTDTYSCNENCKHINELIVAKKGNVALRSTLKSCLMIRIRGPRNHSNPQRRDSISVEISLVQAEETKAGFVL
jgi:hypothetical protein